MNTDEDRGRNSNARNREPGTGNPAPARRDPRRFNICHLASAIQHPVSSIQSAACHRHPPVPHSASRLSPFRVLSRVSRAYSSARRGDGHAKADGGRQRTDDRGQRTDVGTLIPGTWNREPETRPPSATTTDYTDGTDEEGQRAAEEARRGESQQQAAGAEHPVSSIQQAAPPPVACARTEAEEVSGVGLHPCLLAVNQSRAAILTCQLPRDTIPEHEVLGQSVWMAPGIRARARTHGTCPEHHP